MTALASALALSAGPAVSAQQVAKGAYTATADRLYTLDCGLTEFEDAAYFADSGEYNGKSLALPTPCYLVRHGKDWLLWDTGDKLAALPSGETKFGGRFSVKRTLVGKLAQLGLKPDDIRLVALSHLHQDHTGNIPMFPKATFLIATSELAWARSDPTPLGVDAEAIGPLTQDHVEASDDYRDIFGDGTVRILTAPGHTPGSRMMPSACALALPLRSPDDYASRRSRRPPHAIRAALLAERLRRD
jgi:glyoxylase-like metal-dependent hydrolase (beta-lactamase superfamily II)